MFGKLVTRFDPKSTLTVLPPVLRATGARLLAVASVALWLLTGTGYAADGLPHCQNGAGANSTECGTGATTGSATRSTAVGNGADASTNASVAVGRNSVATGQESVAVGERADASGKESVAVGRKAEAAENAVAIGNETIASGKDSTAVGHEAEAKGEAATALGEKSKANFLRATAVGEDAEANAIDATALGNDAIASGEDSTALGVKARATLDNQFVLGRASETYTLPGITSDFSKSRQSGPLELVTTDEFGNLASDGGTIFRDIEENTEGIAMAMALENPDLKGSENFGIAFNAGYFEGEYAVAGAIMATLADDLFSQLGAGSGGRLALAGGAAYGVQHNNFGGRVGLQLTW